MQLKPHKCDSCGISTEHLKFASSVICQPLSAFLTSVVRRLLASGIVSCPPC